MCIRFLICVNYSIINFINRSIFSMSYCITSMIERSIFFSIFSKNIYVQFKIILKLRFHENVINLWLYFMYLRVFQFSNFSRKWIFLFIYLFLNILIHAVIFFSIFYLGYKYFKFKVSDLWQYIDVRYLRFFTQLF